MPSPDLWLFEPEHGRENLIAALRERSVIPFIGAGVSMAAGVGLPGWTQFLEMMAKKRLGEDKAREFGRRLASETVDMEALAEEIYPRGERAVREDIRKIFSGPFDPEKIRGPLKFLPTYFSTGTILTTNYDPLVETVFKAQGCEVDTRAGFNFFALDEALEEAGSVRLCKIHGNTNGEDLVLLKRHYNKKYGEGEVSFAERFTRALRDLIQTKSMLFLGASLVEDRTLLIFDDLYQNRRASLPPHFAFVTRTPHEDLYQQQARLYEYGIEAFIYEATGENHQKVEAYLEELLKEALGTSASLPGKPQGE